MSPPCCKIVRRAYAIACVQFTNSIFPVRALIITVTRNLLGGQLMAVILITMCHWKELLINLQRSCPFCVSDESA